MVIPKIRHILLEKSKPEYSWLLDVVSCGLTTKVDKVVYPDSIFLFDKDICLFRFELLEEGLPIFWCSNKHIWSFFKTNGNLDYEIDGLIKPILEKIFDLDIIMCGNNFDIDEMTFKIFLKFFSNKRIPTFNK